MPTPGERKALLFFGAVALLGIGVRVERSRRPAPAPTPAERAALRRQIARVDSAAAAKRSGRQGRKVPEAQIRRSARDDREVVSVARVDLDRASATEIEVLPRIGPALAARIVADRDSLGPFGSIAAVERVRGIGPAMAKQLEHLVTFSGTPRLKSEPPSVRSRPPSPRKPRAGRHRA